ncbi:hypothetical protein ACTHO0_20150 [Cytobacillus praedii]|uniref:hypothetical protein n=1 Tax=Cytobacillus praedii TaxID=1742358 RepID=UPI003F7F8BDC
MIKRLRIVFAIIATAALLFLNTGPFILYASAWGESNTWTTSPSWNNEPTWKTAPKWETPQWKSPGWNTQPTWKTQPNWQNPGWNTEPSWKTSPDWSSPGWENQPNWNSPGWETQPGWENQPNWNSPGWETQPGWENQPDWQDPNWNDPNGGNSNSNPTPGQNNNINDPTSPDGTKPNNPGDPNSPNPPDDNNPQSNDQTDNQNDSNTENKNNNDKSGDDLDGPFFDFKDPKVKDSIDYIVKDIAGGTINLVDQSLRKGDLTLQDYLKSKGSMGFSGFKVFTKGDPTLDGLYDGIDLVKNSKEVYDKYKIFKEVKDVDNLRKAGDLLEYARHSQDLYEAGKSFSTGNAIVSAITMPLTIYDTVGNIKKLNDAKTAEEKTDAKWDIAENTGSLITGAAPFVAMIPGAQPIAAGMVVVGTAITAVAAGRKIWKNRKEIGKDIVKKAKKVGKWFKSLFKG